MSRLLILGLVGLAFGAVIRVLRLTGVLVDGGIYETAFVFGLGVAVGWAAILLGDYVNRRGTLHPRH